MEHIKEDEEEMKKKRESDLKQTEKEEGWIDRQRGGKQKQGKKIIWRGMWRQGSYQ